MNQKEMEHQPFFMQFITLKSGKTICLTEMNRHDIAEAAHLVALTFSLLNPLYVHLKISPSEAIPYFTEIIRRSVDEKMAFKACDNKKTMAVFISYDLFNSQIKPLDFSKVDSKVLFIPEMHQKLGPKLFPKKNGVVVYLALLGTHPDSFGLGIANQISEIIWNQHPVVSTYPIVYSLFTSPISCKIGSLMGFRRLKSYHPKDYVNQKGEKPFETIEETVKKLKLKDYEGVFAGLRENYLDPRL